MKDPLAFFQECAAQYGEPFTARMFEGPSVYVADPEGIEQVFRANVSALLAGAGNDKLRHETTAISLAWALFFMLERGVSSEELADDAWIDAAVSEALRICPPISAVVRVVAEPFTLMGHELPPGARVVVSALAAHRRAATWPDPDVFRPERFLERTYTPFE